MASEASSVPHRVVPPELVALRQWVAWRLEVVGGRDTKVPYRTAPLATSKLRKASSTDPDSWSSFEEATATCQRPDVDGIGFVVTKETGLTFVDLDHAMGDDGQAKPWARAILRHLNSYTELSPSGTGFHVLVKGNLPGPRCRTSHEDGIVEMYDHARYFTFLGKPYAGYETIQERQVKIDELYKQLFKPEPEPQEVAPVLPLPVNLDDRELLERAMNARNGHRFQALWEGDTSAYVSHNEADLALCGMLAFWTGGNANRIDHLFRQSGLVRGKWDEKRGQRTYGQMTIAKALEGKTEFYQPESRAGGEIRHGGTSADETTSVQTIPADRPVEPDTPPEEIFHGLAGRLTALIEPYVESNEMSVLAQFLVAFGVAVGTRPHFMVGATRHAPALYLGLVGQTSRARKGTSWDPVESLFRQADPNFARRIVSGVGSGERLVYLVRDARYEDDKDGRSKLADAGAEDPRLLLQEPELARLLTVVNREGSTMSAYLRSAYDGKPLRNEVKTGGSISSTHHIGMVGHCTSDDLVGQLREQEIRNGLANRIVWIAARRDKRLADPPIFAGGDVQDAATELRLALDRAKRAGTLRRHAAAQRLWNEWYLALPDSGMGILDAITSRRESLVIRASMIYALTDGVEIIGVDHLRAAIALDEFSARCAAHIFGGSTGNALADRILEELRVGPLFKTEIYSDLFHRNISAAQLLEAQKLLERRGQLVRERVISGGRGRPAERWRLA